MDAPCNRKRKIIFGGIAGIKSTSAHSQGCDSSRCRSSRPLTIHPAASVHPLQLPRLDPGRDEVAEASADPVFRPGIRRGTPPARCRAATRISNSRAQRLSATLSALPRPMAKLTDEQRRALQLLARSPNGCTEALMMAHGFEVAMLSRLVLKRTCGCRRSQHDGRPPAHQGDLAADHRGGAEGDRGSELNEATAFATMSSPGRTMTPGRAAWGSAFRKATCGCPSG
jgi:hypothetical protein